MRTTRLRLVSVVVILVDREDPDVALKYGSAFQERIAASRHVKIPPNHKPYKQLDATCQ